MGISTSIIAASSVAWEVLRARKAACRFVVEVVVVEEEDEEEEDEVKVLVPVTVEVDVTVVVGPVTVEVVPGPVTVVVGPVTVEVDVEVSVVVLPLSRASVATAATIAPTTSPPPIFRKVLLEGSPAFWLSAI